MEDEILLVTSARVWVWLGVRRSSIPLGVPPIQLNKIKISSPTWL